MASMVWAQQQPCRQLQPGRLAVSRAWLVAAPAWAQARSSSPAVAEGMLRRGARLRPHPRSHLLGCAVAVATAGCCLPAMVYVGPLCFVEKL